MACEICTHTMRRVTPGPPAVFWCPRCGTLKTERLIPTFEAPMIVQQARELCEAVKVPARLDGQTVSPLEIRRQWLKDCCLPPSERAEGR